jgi:predicted transcriptional regulator
MAKARKERYSFVMKPSVRARLEEIADDRECSLSEIVQEALDEYLKDK